MTVRLARERVAGGHLGRGVGVVLALIALGRTRRRRRGRSGSRRRRVLRGRVGLGRRSRLGLVRRLAGGSGLGRRSGLLGGRRGDRRLGLGRLDRPAVLVVLHRRCTGLLLLAGRLLVEVLLDVVQLLLRLVGELLGLVKEPHGSLLSRVGSLNHRRCSTPTTGERSSDPTLRTASSTPGMNEVRSIESCLIVSVWPTSPRSTSWWATRPGSRTEWIGTSPFISAAVRAAVPEGTSILRSWWSSMISALAMCREASAANCIISTAPMAKFGATNTLAPVRPSISSRSQPVVPTTTCTPSARHWRTLCGAASGVVKSTTTSASPSTSAGPGPSEGSARPTRSRSSAA